MNFLADESVDQPAGRSFETCAILIPSMVLSALPARVLR